MMSGSIGNKVWVGEVRGESIYKSIYVTFGVRSKLTLKESGVIIMTVEDGACNSGVLINNGDTPLCSYYEYDEFESLTKTRNTVNALEFTYESFI